MLSAASRRAEREHPIAISCQQKRILQYSAHLSTTQKKKQKHPCELVADS